MALKFTEHDGKFLRFIEPQSISYGSEAIERIYQQESALSAPVLWGKPFTMIFSGTYVKFSSDNGATWSDTLTVTIYSGDRLSVSQALYPSGGAINCWKGEYVTDGLLKNASEKSEPSDSNALRYTIRYRPYTAADIGASSSQVEFDNLEITWPTIWEHFTTTIPRRVYYDNTPSATGKLSRDLRSDDGDYISSGHVLNITASCEQYAGAGDPPSYEGIQSLHSSTSATATSGNSWDYKYPVGTTVYYFVVLKPGYTPLSGWTLISGRCYRVATVTIPSGGQIVDPGEPDHTVLRIYFGKASGSDFTWINTATGNPVSSINVFYGWYGVVTSFSDNLEVEIYDESSIRQLTVEAIATTGYTYTSFSSVANLDYSTPNFYVQEGVSGTIYGTNSGISCPVYFTAGTGIASIYSQASGESTTHASGYSYPNGAVVSIFVTVATHFTAPSDWQQIVTGLYRVAEHTIDSATDYNGYNFGTFSAQVKTYTLNQTYGNPCYNTNYSRSSGGSLITTASYGDSIYYRPVLIDQTKATFAYSGSGGYQKQTSKNWQSITLNDSNFDFNESTLIATPKPPNYISQGGTWPMCLVLVQWTQSTGSHGNVYSIGLSYEQCFDDETLYTYQSAPANYNEYAETFYDGQPGEYWCPYDMRPRTVSGSPYFTLSFYLEGYNLDSHASQRWYAADFGHTHGGTGWFIYDFSTTGGGSSAWYGLDLQYQIVEYGLPVNLGALGSNGWTPPATYSVSYTGAAYGTHSGGSASYISGSSVSINLGTYTANATAGYNYYLTLSCNKSGADFYINGSHTDSITLSAGAATTSVWVYLPAATTGTVTITATWTRGNIPYNIYYTQSGSTSYGYRTGGATSYTVSTSQQTKSAGTWTVSQTSNLYTYRLTLVCSNTNCHWSASSTNSVTYSASASETFTAPSLIIPANTTGDITITYSWSRIRIDYCPQCLADVDIPTILCTKCYKIEAN